MELLASGRSKSFGRRPARKPDGTRLPMAGPEHEAVPATTFLNAELAFSASGELIHRLPLLDRLFSGGPPGDETDTGIPLFYDVMLESAGLRDAWGINRSGILEEVSRSEAPSQAKKVSQHRHNYMKDDASLVSEMHTLVTAKDCSPWQAAMAVADRAKAKNTKLESRAKRLLSRYSKQFGSEQS